MQVPAPDQLPPIDEAGEGEPEVLQYTEENCDVEDSADISVNMTRNRVHATNEYNLEKRTFVLDRLHSAFSKAMGDVRSEREQTYIVDAPVSSEAGDDEDRDLEDTRLAKHKGSIVERKPGLAAGLKKFSDSKVSMGTLQNEKAPSAFPAYLLEKHEELSYHQLNTVANDFQRYLEPAGDQSKSMLSSVHPDVIDPKIQKLFESEIEATSQKQPDKVSSIHFTNE